MREAYNVIIEPVVTEKSTRQMEERNIYTFIVSQSANKHDIARAVEKLWDVKVQAVRTMRYAGKQKRAPMARMTKNWSQGRRPSFKKAVVQLAEGDHIELYEVG